MTKFFSIDYTDPETKQQVKDLKQSVFEDTQKIAALFGNECPAVRNMSKILTALNEQVNYFTGIPK